MPESIQYLENELRRKEHELDDAKSAVTGAGIGALLTRGSVIGAAAGALLTRDKDKRDQLEREIADLKTKLDATRDQISRLQTRRSELMNSYQNDKARFDADKRQQYNDLDRQRHEAQTPELARQFDDQLMRFRDDLKNEELSRSRTHDQELEAVQQEIDRLTF